jgi:hypothetical protein
MAYRSGFSRQRARQRQRFLLRLALALLGLGVFLGLGYSSYLAGAKLARMEVRSLEEDITRLGNQITGLRVENDQLRSDLSQTRQSADALKRRYDADVPGGSAATLFALARDRVNAGVREDRIAQVLREAENPRACEGRVSRKRVVIHNAGQAEDPVGLLEGLIQVSVSAPAGADDPAKAASVTIQRVWSNQPLKLSGLPARQAIPINNAELRLIVEPSELRGYATVSLSLCGRG